MRQICLVVVLHWFFSKLTTQSAFSNRDNLIVIHFSELLLLLLLLLSDGDVTSIDLNGFVLFCTRQNQSNIIWCFVLIMWYEFDYIQSCFHHFSINTFVNAFMQLV